MKKGCFYTIFRECDGDYGCITVWGDELEVKTGMSILLYKKAVVAFVHSPYKINEGLIPEVVLINEREIK